MKLTHNWTFLISILLLFTSMYLVGKLGSQILQRFVISLPALPENPKLQQKNKKVPLQDPPQAKSQFNTVLTQNIFDAKRKEKPKAPEPQKPAPVEEAPIEDTGPAVTSINVDLLGTVIFEGVGFAFISKKGAHSKYVTFQAGDCINLSKLERDPECSKGTIQLTKVENRKVHINNKGNAELLLMEEYVPPGFPQADDKDKIAPKKRSYEAKPKKKRHSPVPDKPKPVDEGPAPEPEVVDGEEVFYLQKTWVDEQLANFAKIIRDARVVPMTKDDGQTYFRFKFIKPKSLYEQLGLRKGDIILEVNTTKIDNIAKAMSLMETLKSESEILLKVERKGEFKSFRYYIE